MRGSRESGLEPLGGASVDALVPSSQRGRSRVVLVSRGERGVALGIALVRSATVGDLREDAIGYDEVTVNVEHSSVPGLAPAFVALAAAAYVPSSSK